MAYEEESHYHGRESDEYWYGPESKRTPRRRRGDPPSEKLRREHLWDDLSLTAGVAFMVLTLTYAITGFEDMNWQRWAFIAALFVVIRWPVKTVLTAGVVVGLALIIKWALIGSAFFSAVWEGLA